MTNFYGEHSKVWLSVDCIIFGFDEGKLKILIGRRKMDPGRGEWSLYGGFVAADESIDDAATRTVSELTGLNNLYMRQVGAFGRIDRDPGERVISIAYYALINVKDYDDELRLSHGVEWVDITESANLTHEEIPKAGELVQCTGGGIVDTLVAANEASVEAPFAATRIHLTLADKYLQLTFVEAENDTVYRQPDLGMFTIECCHLLVY